MSSVLGLDSNEQGKVNSLDENDDESYDEYQIDSEDSDEDDEDPDIEVALPISKIVTIEDLEELKSKTVDLLDPSWKVSRNEHLIRKMLELEDPTITSQVSATAWVCSIYLFPHLLRICFVDNTDINFFFIFSKFTTHLYRWLNF